jgi:hypothetical protein
MNAAPQQWPFESAASAAACFTCRPAENGATCSKHVQAIVGILRFCEVKALFDDGRSGPSWHYIQEAKQGPELLSSDEGLDGIENRHECLPVDVVRDR